MIKRLLITLAWIVGIPAVYFAGVGFWYAVLPDDYVVKGAYWALGLPTMALQGLLYFVGRVWWDWVRNG